MDVAETGVLMGGVAVIAFTLWFFFGGRRESGRREKNILAEPGAVVYACPMHPWITSSDPAAMCSICGMKLVRRD